MSGRPSRASLMMGLVAMGLLGCALAETTSRLPSFTEQPPGVPPASASWTAEVGARIRDASHAIVPVEQAFRAGIPERGLTASFDDEGAHIVIEGGSVVVGSASRRAPALGACIADMQHPGGECVQRLEYVDGTATEWWAARAEGFEQGWTVTGPQGGGGPLTLHVAITGAEVRLDDGDLWIEGDGGGLLSVTGLQATDAAGVVLDAHFEPDAAGFAITVDTARARYPIEIDPVYTTPGWTVVGTPADDALGYSVSGAGDVNGDGYDDVIVGAYASVENAGRAYVYEGTASGVSGVASTTLTSAGADSHFGDTVAGAGDVNGDGYDDVIVSASNYDSNLGRVYVYEGSPSGVADRPSAYMTGEASGSAFGCSASGAGDVNGDGFDDIIVGSYMNDSSTGRAYVYTGSPSGISVTATTTLTGASAGDEFGYAVSSAGDVDGDGYDDVIVSAQGYAAHTGRAYVHHGSATGLSGAATTTLEGATGSYFGSSVSGLGDTNGDGYDDIVVGAPAFDSARGLVYVFLGSAGGVADTASTTMTGLNRDSVFGRSVSGAGDVNGDTYPDLLVGAHVGTGHGSVYLYLGAGTGMSDAATVELTGEADDDHFGRSVSAAGDVDGDGYEDVIVGADGYGAGSGTGPGRAYVYAGSAGGLTTPASTTVTGKTTGDCRGCAVSAAGDVNGDGYDDVIVGAYSYGDELGAAYVYQGTSAGLSSTATSTLTGDLALGAFGFSVSGAGDVNGDGYDDVIVGAVNYDENRGRAYVFHGSPAGVALAPATTLTADERAALGYSVGAAGDVNGDGYDDVVVGASSFNLNYGRAFLYRGSPTGVSNSPSTTWDGTLESGGFGHAVSGAGDVNGDGYDDVIVGAAFNGTGRAYVYAGSPAGAESSVWVELGADNPIPRFGVAVAGAGDVDGDGYADVIVGACNCCTEDLGRAYLYSGSAAGLSSTPSTTLLGHETYDYFGADAASAGDVNGDGFGDVIVGEPAAGDHTGAAYVYLGAKGGLSTSPSTTFNGAVANNSFGSAVDGVGDVNGDGYVDVIVGVSGDGDGAAGAAFVYYGYADTAPDTDGEDTATPDDSESGHDSDTSSPDGTGKGSGCPGSGCGASSGSAAGLALAALAGRRRRR